MRSSGTFVGPRRAPPVAVCRQRQWQVWVSAPSVASVPHQVPAVLADILLSRAFSEMLLALRFFFFCDKIKNMLSLWCRVRACAIDNRI